MPELTKTTETLPAISSDDTIRFAPNFIESIWHQGKPEEDSGTEVVLNSFLSICLLGAPSGMLLHGSHHVSEVYFQASPSSSSSYGARVLSRPHLSDLLCGYLTTPSESIAELRARLVDLVENIELEPFKEHPAEYAARQMFSNYEIASRKWAIALDEKTRVAPDIIEILSRFKPADKTWRSKCIAEWLKSPSVQIRDAAIRAAENWGEEDSILALRAHDEKIDWLHAEIQTILENH